LTVYPANTLIQYYWWNKIVIINRDSTTQDRFADILFHENLGKVFGEIKA
jgi:NAD-dependent deacetylase